MPKQYNSIRPIVRLGKGHLVLMSAGGYIKGEIEMDGKRLVVKEVARKSETMEKQTASLLKRRRPGPKKQ